MKSITGSCAMVPQFEQNAIEDGIILIKYFLDVSQDEQGVSWPG